MDLFSLQIYLNHFLISHSGGGEHWQYTYKNQVEKQRKTFLEAFPVTNEFKLPVYTPDLSPHQYMDQVLKQLRRLPAKMWAHDHFIPWLHDLILNQNLFTRTEFDQKQDKKPDPCITTKIQKRGRRLKEQYSRTFLAGFEADIDPEQACMEIRRLLRFFHQELGRTRVLNLITGYHTTLTRKSKTKIEVETYCLTTPAQLGIHGTIQKYIREFSPNRLFTLHLGDPLPGLMTLDKYISPRAHPAEPPILISQSTGEPENETLDDTISIDRYNKK